MLKQDPHDHLLYETRLHELESIANAVGYAVCHRKVQTKIKPNPKYLVGGGKVEEIREIVEEKNCETTIFWNILSSRQKYDIERILGNTVIDRSELILELFANNASTLESKLQVNLARLRKQFPYERYRALQRFHSERPGLRSFGEYAYHRKVKELQSAIKKTERNLERIKWRREKETSTRRGIGKVIALTGFYNAGKTTLFNALTKSNQKCADYPFTTLASKVARCYIAGKNYFLIDSIGLIQDLEELNEIITSFELTLSDVRNADLVLCLLDFAEEIAIVNRKLDVSLKILNSLDVTSDRILLVLNKTDMVEDDRANSIELAPKHVFISARRSEGLLALKGLIASKLDEKSKPILQRRI